MPSKVVIYGSPFVSYNRQVWETDHRDKMEAVYNILKIHGPPENFAIVYGPACSVDRIVSIEFKWRVGCHYKLGIYFKTLYIVKNVFRLVLAMLTIWTENTLVGRP
jgi:hypothetical protein